MNAVSLIAGTQIGRLIVRSTILSLFLLIGATNTWSQSEVRSKFQDEFYRLEKMVSQAKFVRYDKGLRKTYGFSTLFPSSSFGEGWIDASDIVSEKRQYKKKGTQAKQIDNEYFHYEAILRSDVDLTNCFCVLTFAGDGGRSVFLQDIGKLVKGKDKKIELEIIANVSKIGRLHVFSSGFEIKSTLVPKEYDLLKDEYAALEESQGVPATRLWSEENEQYYTLSPSGRYLALIRDDGGTNQIKILDSQTDLKLIRTIQVGDHDDFASGLHWIDDEEFIFVSDDSMMRASINGDKIEVLEKDVRYTLFQNSGNRRKVLVRSKSKKSYYLYDIDKGTKDIVGYAGSERWRRFDANGELRLKREDDNGSIAYFYRPRPRGPWVSLDETVTQDGLKFNYKESDSLEQTILVNGLGRNDDELFVYYCDDGNTYKLATYSLSEGRISGILIGSKTYDVGGHDPSKGFAAILRNSSWDTIGVKFSASKQRVTWFHPDFAFVQETIDKNFPDDVNQLIDWTDDATAVVFKRFSDKHPGQYYLFKPLESRLVLLHDSYPSIKDSELGTMKPVTYATRDGYDIRGYLTTPPGYNGQSRLPIVVMPHKDPWVRDYWEFSAPVQYFATRGYAVLQPNYRGSSGYGLKHIQSGVENLDTVIIDDVVDGVRHFIDQGVVDPDNVFIMGERFGGYLTYMGLIKYPDLFRAGVAIGALSHLGKEINRDMASPTNFTFESWKKAAGNFNDMNFVRQVSPYFHADKIKGALLLFHDELDLFVSDEQSQLMAEALSKADVDHEVTYFPSERRSFGSADAWLTSNRAITMRFYSEAEQLFREKISISHQPTEEPE